MFESLVRINYPIFTNRFQAVPPCTLFQLIERNSLMGPLDQKEKVR